MRQPRWLDPNYDKARRSKKNERRWAEKLGGKRVARSGGLPVSKWTKRTAGGDVRLPDFYIEHKMTVGQALGVKKAWLERIAEEAALRGLSPALGMTFEGGMKAEKDWVAIPLSIFEGLRRLVETRT